MKRHTLATFVFAALLGLSAQAQVITNYGPGDGTSTNSGAYNAANGYTGGSYPGTWDGGSGKAISPTVFIAQTFLTPGLSGTVQLYAYNFQLNIQAPTVPNLGFAPTFTSALYVWNSTGTGTDGNSTTGSLGAQVSPTLSITPVIGNGFNLYGTNAVVAPGVGATLDANTVYALVIQRTDTPPATGLGGSVVQYGWDVGGNYANGGLYTGTGGGFTASGTTGTQDMAFWVSFTSNALSPVPEPAVSGMMIGGVLLAGFIAIRRFRNKSASVVTTTA